MLKNFPHAGHATQTAAYLQQCRWPHDKRKSPSAFPFLKTASGLPWDGLHKYCPCPCGLKVKLLQLGAHSAL